MLSEFVHPRLSSGVHGDTQITRYVTLEVLFSLLRKNSLHLSLATNFEDPSDCSPTGRHATKDFFDPSNPQDLARLRDIMRPYIQVADNTYVNCWTMLDGESWLLWNRYTTSAVAIQSDVKSLIESLGRPASILKWGKVYYRENNPEEIYEDPMTCVFSKHRHYADERELRLVFHDGESFQTTNGFRFDARHRAGVEVKVDPSKLIHKIVTPPGTPRWAHDTIKETIKRYDRSLVVQESSITHRSTVTSPQNSEVPLLS